MSRRRSDDGYILVAVLAVAVVLTGLVAAGSLVIRSGSGAARVADRAVASAGLLLSGVEVTAYQLAVLRVRADRVDGRPIRLTGGTVTPHVVDEGGKIDLNAASPKLLAGVFADIGMDGATADAVVQRIVALRGPSNGVISAAGAAAAASPGIPSAGAQVPSDGVSPPAPAPGGTAPARRRGFQSVDDLRGIEGVRREDMRPLRDRLTVFNPDGRINVLSASPDVLMSMPGMTELKLRQLLAAREAAPGDASAAQAALGGDLASFIKAVPGPAYTVRIDAHETGGRQRNAVVVVAASKTPAVPYYILDWQE